VVLKAIDKLNRKRIKRNTPTDKKTREWEPVLKKVFFTFLIGPGNISIPLFDKSTCRWNSHFTFSGVATITIEGRPGDPPIMAFSTVLPFNDFDHGNIIGPAPHFKNIRMTDLAFKSNPVEPMRKNDRWNTRLFGIPVHGNIAVLSSRRGRKRTFHKNQP
jgi:hypothetical protein